MKRVLIRDSLSKWENYVATLGKEFAFVCVFFCKSGAKFSSIMAKADGTTCFTILRQKFRSIQQFEFLNVFNSIFQLRNSALNVEICEL